MRRRRTYTCTTCESAFTGIATRVMLCPECRAEAVRVARNEKRAEARSTKVLDKGSARVESIR